MKNNRFTHHRLAAACLLQAAAALTAAPAVAQSVPDAGSLLREVPPATAPQAPAAPPPAPLSREVADTGPAFAVTQILFKGNSAVPAEALRALAGDAVGPRVTLARIQATAERLTAYYRAQGYPLSRVVVPQQDVTQGVLTLEVIEARLGQVVIENQGRVNTEVLSRLSSPLQQGEAITDKAVDRALLLMSDVPGTRIRATIRPGQDVGTSDIAIANGAGPLTSSLVSIDNEGNRHTGRTRVLGQLQVFSPLRQGDLLGLTALSTGGNMRYGRVSYDIPVDHLGSRAGGSWARLNYKLGAELSALGAQGDVGTGSLWLRHPFVRNQRWNLHGQVQLAVDSLSDRVDSTQIQQDRRIEMHSLSLSGDARDESLQGGTTSWGVTLGQGSVRFKNGNAALADAASAQVAGPFTKLSWNLSRVQFLGDRFSLLASVNGQRGSNNLDSSQKLGLGGTGAVRAYRSSVVSGDSGYLARVELRYTLPMPEQDGSTQLIAAWDQGHVRINQRPWAAVTGDNRVTLRGLGLGMRWNGGDPWSADLSFAVPIGSRPSQVTEKRSAATWVKLTKGF